MYANLKGFNVVAKWIENTIDLNVHWNLYGEICRENIVYLNQIRNRSISNFSVCGYKTTEEIFEEIDILVNASTQFDSYPTVLLEAARAGIASVANTNGGAREIIQHTITGFIYNAEVPDEGYSYLKKLISSPELIKTISSNAANYFLKNFTVEKMSDAYKKFWQKVAPIK